MISHCGFDLLFPNDIEHLFIGLLAILVSSLVKSLFIYFAYFIYLCIYFWLRWVFAAARGLSLVASSRGYYLLRCAGFSLQWLLLLQSTGSRQAQAQ